MFDEINTLTEEEDSSSNLDVLLKDNQNAIDNIIEEPDSAIEQYADNPSDLMEEGLQPFENKVYNQIKFYLSEDTNFFTSQLIETVAQIALSQHVLQSHELQQAVADTILIFVKMCDGMKNLDKQFASENNNISTIDNLVIDSLKKVGDIILSDTIPYSPYMVKKVFNEFKDMPNYYGNIHADKQTNEQYNRLIDSDIDISLDYVNTIKDEIDSKYRSLGTISALKKFSQYFSKGITEHSNFSEFLQGFNNVINETAAVMTNAVDSNNGGITVSEVLNSSAFYSTIIRNSDTHIRCGISTFDAITNGGFEKDRICIVAGKTGGGKSTLMLNLGHGMVKSGNGLNLPDIAILNKLSNNPDAINVFRNYQKHNVEDMYAKDVKKYGSSAKDLKHLIFYVTLENSEYETAKRYLCRFGLVTSILWELINRDPLMSGLATHKGFNFTMDNLPDKMSEELKRRLVAISSYINILKMNCRSDFYIWWQPPYTITTYDIFMECKRLERLGHVIDAIFIDYPDKMNPIGEKYNNEQTWDKLGKIIDNLKALAKQDSVPIIAPSQLTRQGNKDSGNKNNIIKGGFTAGSQQKESNSDILINMNIHSKDDNELVERIDMFKRYQHHINQSRLSVVDSIFDPRMDFEHNIETINRLNIEAERAPDILQLANNVPDIQTITNYVVKNRDGISDISFETYIGYGIYLVTDHDEEAIQSAQFAADTYSMIIDYMLQAKLISDRVAHAAKSVKEFFNRKIEDFISMSRAQFNSNGPVNEMRQRNTYSSGSSNNNGGNNYGNYMPPSIKQ